MHLRKYIWWHTAHGFLAGIAALPVGFALSAAVLFVSRGSPFGWCLACAAVVVPLP